MHCGTVWVHGPSVEVPTTELQPRRPFGEYGIRKAQIEAYLLAEARRNGFPATILHPGHIEYLEQARALGQRLIVAVNDDDSVRRLKGDGRPVNPLAHRLRMLAALGCVDWVVPFAEDTPERLICAVLPDLLVKGGDYTPDQIAGGDCVRRAGGEVKVLGFVEGHSTTGLIERIRDGG